MLKVGDDVEVLVYLCEDYGLFAKGPNDEQIFIHMPEITWSRAHPVDVIDFLNRMVNVKISKFVSEFNEWYASIRRAHGVPNPYDELLNVSPDRGFLAKVRTLWRPDGAGVGNYVVLENGTYGRLLENDENLKINEEILVRIIEVDPSKGELVVQLADDVKKG